MGTDTHEDTHQRGALRKPGQPPFMNKNLIWNLQTTLNSKFELILHLLFVIKYQLFTALQLHKMSLLLFVTNLLFQDERLPSTVHHCDCPVKCAVCVHYNTG